MAKRANNFIDLTSKKFGKLTVIGLNKIDNKNPFWNCICECGTQCIKRGANLKSGGTTSCGCHSQERKKINKGQSGYNKLFSEYKNGAKKRGLHFSLTDEEFKQITKQNCHYCNIEPKQESFSSNKKLTNEGKEHGKYIYNGIDRKDNNVGYITGNCLPCCFLCNKAKSGMSYDDFINYIKRFKR